MSGEMKRIMKRKRAMNYRLPVLQLLVILCLLPGTLSAQSFSEKRTFKKTVKANKEMTLEVKNKYGTIHILPSNSDSVSITAEIEAFASSQSRIGKMLEGINVNITETDYMIIARTEFTQSLNMILEDFKGMTNKFIPYDSRVQINYTIIMPEYLNLKIDNRYGDVYLEDNSGSVSISVSNGSFKANSLNKASDLSLSFCNATINKVNEANIDATFSEMVIGESGDLKINSISTRYDIKYCNHLNAESKRDKFFIGTLSSLQGNSYFTDFRIDKLKEEANISLKYGSISTTLIEKGFKGIDINSGYSDIMLTFDPSASYNLDMKHVNTFVTLPEKSARLQKKTVDEDKKEFVTYGTVGKPSGDVRVRIDANRGNIILK